MLEVYNPHFTIDAFTISFSFTRHEPTSVVEKSFKIAYNELFTLT